MMRRLASLPLLATLLIAGCTPPPHPAPTPPKPAPTQPPAPRPAAPIDWRDLAETKGAWRYVAEGGATSARYEAGGTPLFTLRCDKATRKVTLNRPDAAADAPLKVTTSYGDWTRDRPASNVYDANDPRLDQIAFSRGRFTIEAAGLPELVLPAWAEPARVIEDCRG